LTLLSSERTQKRAELLDLLLAHGILHRSETQPVLSRDGSSARWMLDSLPVTLTPRGAELAGQLLLERLASFDGHQLATYGLTAVPILQSAILQSNGYYHGLLVRRERKQYGSQKLIEGRISLDEPTILIEDSIASGTNVNQGIDTLESAGLRIEGCVALVRFGWEGGFSDLRERGYHMEAVYDIFEDFMTRMEGEEGPDHNPTKIFSNLRWSWRRAPEGLHPAQLARAVLQEYFRSGEVLRWPTRLDSDSYDSSGGAWVSLRSHNDILDRHARDGFWHFPGESSWGACEDIVRAAFRTACQLPPNADTSGLLASSYIAVTFFSALEQVTVGELDNDRNGIVVVSKERPEIMGGALPRMPGIRDEWQQLSHARYNNAGLYAFEPYIIYSHDVSKFIEPGAPWPTSGVAGSEDVPHLAPLAAWARDLIRLHEPREWPTIGSIPSNAEQIFVTIYIDGGVRGCMGCQITDLRENLYDLTHAALVDDRFDDVAIEEDSTIAVSISLLYNQLEMGDFSPEEVRIRYRHGQQALMVEQNSRQALLLPFVATWMNLDAEDFVDEVLDKAGITRPPYNWRRFDCVTWLADENGTAQLEGGFKISSPSLTIDEIAYLHCKYLERNQQTDGSLYFGYSPFQNTLYRGIDVARQAHAAWTLARAGFRDAATAALKYISTQPVNPPLALSCDAFTFLAMCELGMPDRDDQALLAAKLLASIDRNARVTTWQPASVTVASEDEDNDLGENDSDEEDQETIDPEELQNYIPGQVLLALAAAARSGCIEANEQKIERAFRYYRHRFRHKRDFGQVSWMSLAAASWYRITKRREWAELAFEITDWILEFQQTKTGAFLTDHQPDTPGFTTAVYLDAIAAGFHVAAEFDSPRFSRYDDAWRRGFAFLDRLIIQERDTSILPNADYAIGGLRENLYSSHLRIDFVQHSLAAILGRHPHISLSAPKNKETRHGETQEIRANRGSCTTSQKETSRANRGSRTAEEKETSRADRGSRTTEEKETSRADRGSRTTSEEETPGADHRSRTS
jgi:AMMECR1 domain-containing protein/orotate phosphoribosyltransferase